MSVNTYNRLLHHFETNKYFKIDRQKYSYKLQNRCEISGIIPEESHALSWDFCKRRMMEYANAGSAHRHSQQAVSWEMKHNRANNYLI